jgi:hypothetical protein
MEIGNAVRESSRPVLGWRAWVVRETWAGLRLGSVLHDLVWPVAAPVVAECRREEDPFAEPLAPHPVPAAVCNCGFHAARDPVDALSYTRGREEAGTVCRILGEVRLWGHVLATEGGWRASHAYPVRLYVPDPVVAVALAVYGVRLSSPSEPGPQRQGSDPCPWSHGPNGKGLTRALGATAPNGKSLTP